MAHIIISSAGRYEVEKVGEFGEVYKWRPGTVVIECTCGERPTLTSSMTYCECGGDHTAVVREWLAVRRREEDTRPWRQSGDLEDTGLSY